MITVTKQFEFEAAHLLIGHDGACKNVHGHSYKLEVEVQRIGPPPIEGPKKGMVVDFGDLKRIVKEAIVDKIDHSFIMDSNMPLDNFLNHDMLKSQKVYWIPFLQRSTCECMVEYFANILTEELAKKDEWLELTRIRLWETSTSYAEWTPDAYIGEE